MVLDDSDQGKVATVAPISSNRAESQKLIMDKELGPFKSETHPLLSSRGSSG